MRYIKLLVASVLLVSMTACTVDNESDLDIQGYIKTINIVGPDKITFEQIGGSEQTKATSVDNGSALVFRWAADDTLGIFPNKGNQVEFPITSQESSTSATFDGGGWALRNNASYAAYYPFNVWNYHLNNKTIVLDYSGQVQNGNGSFAHLSAYDYLASAKTTPENNMVTFQMDRQGSILYIDIVVPEPATITSLTISCNEAIFVEKAALDISGNNPVVTPVETKESLTLAFENTATTRQNETVRAYMAVQPLDFSSKTVIATLITEAGTFTAPVVSRVVNKGKAAFLRFSESFKGRIVITDDTSALLTYKGGTASFNFASDVEFQVNISSNATSWVSQSSTRSLSNHTLDFTVAPNQSTSQRTAVITVSSPRSTESIEFTITQYGRTNSFAITSAGSDAKVPTISGGNLSGLVDWGDEVTLWSATAVYHWGDSENQHTAEYFVSNANSFSFSNLTSLVNVDVSNFN